MVKYIGKVNMENIRNFILDNNLQEGSILAINQRTCDELAIDYRRIYNDSLTLPLAFLGVSIKSDSSGKTPEGRIRVAEEDETEWVRIIDLPTEPENETIYRCGWCGNVVMEDGREFDDYTRTKKIELLEQYRPEQRNVNGECCRNSWMNH